MTYWTTTSSRIKHDTTRIEKQAGTVIKIKKNLLMKMLNLRTIERCFADLDVVTELA